MMISMNNMKNLMKKFKTILIFSNSSDRVITGFNKKINNKSNFNSKISNFSLEKKFKNFELI